MRLLRAFGAILLACTSLAAGLDRSARAEAPVWQIPQTIRVRITGKPEVCDTNAPYTVRVVPFQDYVAAVLPAEWEGGWPSEAYRAGAIAVKMYAWYWIERGGKWPDADVYDSVCDQVYDPRKLRPATSQAVADTWNWVLTRNGQLFETRHKHSDRFGCSAPFCMEQILSRDLARAGHTWDEILQAAYGDIELTALNLPESGFALEFDGANSLQIPAGDHLSADFTIEWWLKVARTGEAITPPECHPAWEGEGAPRLLDGSNLWVALSGGRLALGVRNENGDGLTLCGQINLADGGWHHLALQRRAADGALWLFTDGRLQDSTPAFSGDLLRAETLRLGKGLHGWMDELRLSDGLRYSDDFIPPTTIFQPDALTVSIYHFDEGFGDPPVSQRIPGGVAGPRWVRSTLFASIQPLYLPILWRSGQ